MRGTALLVCLALWGCGDDGGNNHPPDAPHSDSGQDIDAPPTQQPVTITITNAGAPLADVDVYFQKADSSLIAKVTTDATGTASQVMDAGGYVTVVDAFYQIVLTRQVRPGGTRGAHDVHTFVGVKPGDHLRLSEARVDSQQFTVTVPEDTGATDTYVFGASTDSNNYPQSAVVDPTSHQTDVLIFGGLTATDFLVVTADAGTGKFIYAKDVSLATSGGISIPGPYAANIDATATFTNLPDIGTVNTTNYLIGGHGPFWANSTGSDIAGTGATIHMDRAAPANVTSLYETDISGFDDNSTQILVDWAPIAANASIDAANRRLTTYASDFPPEFDRTTHRVKWTEDAGGVAPDAAVAHMSFTLDGATFLTWTWDVVAPHSATGFALPVLPGDAAQFNGDDADDASVTSVTSAKVPGGYDAVRAGALSGSILAVASVTASGSFAYSDWPRSFARKAAPVKAIGAFLKNRVRKLR